MLLDMIWLSAGLMWMRSCHLLYDGGVHILHVINKKIYSNLLLGRSLAHWQPGTLRLHKLTIPSDLILFFFHVHFVSHHIHNVHNMCSINISITYYMYIYIIFLLESCLVSLEVQIMNMYEHGEHKTYLNNSLIPFAFECVVFVYVLYHPIFISILNLFNNIHKFPFSSHSLLPPDHCRHHNISYMFNIFNCFSFCKWHNILIDYFYALFLFRCHY